jgi:sensor domain CHASE-containing protein
MNEQRLEELEAFKAKLEMQLNETVFLIQGYKNAIETEKAEEPEEV